MVVTGFVTSMEFEQEADTCSPDRREQLLIVRQENGGLEREHHYYVVETERWAFNDIEEFVALLRKAGCRDKMQDEQ